MRKIIIDEEGPSDGRWFYIKVDPWEAGIVYICFRESDFWSALNTAKAVIMRHGYDPMQLMAVAACDEE